jgi:hypothetical protein
MKRYSIILITLIGYLSAANITQAQTPYVSWEYNFSSPEEIYSLALKNDNSVLYTGTTGLTNGDSCLSKDISKVASIWFGNLNSSKSSFTNFCYSKEDSSSNYGTKVITENDTIFDIFGSTTDTTLYGAINHGEGDIFFMRVTSNGTVLSCKLYGSPGNEFVSSAQRAKDGGWIVVGLSDDTGGDVPSHYWSSSGFPTTDIWLIKLNSEGNIQWSDILGGTDNQFSPQVIEGTDGYYYMCGGSVSHDYDLENANPIIGANVFIVKIDSVGNKKKIGIYGGYASSVINFPSAFSQLKNSKLLFSGFTNAVDSGNGNRGPGNEDLWVVELDTALNPIWYPNYITSGGADTYCADNMLMPDGSIIVAGEHDASDVFVMRIDSIGNLIWRDSIGVTNYNWSTYIEDGIVLDNNDIMLCGNTDATSGIIGDPTDTLYDHTFLIELSDVTGIAPSPVSENYNLSVYPNPFSQDATIKLDGGNRQHWQFILQDLLGRTVADYNNDGQTSLTLSRNNLSSGLYIGIARDDEGQMLGRAKIVVQ